MLDLFLRYEAHGWQVVMTVPKGRAQEHPESLFQPRDLVVVSPKLAELSARGRASVWDFRGGRDRQRKRRTKSSREAECAPGGGQTPLFGPPIDTLVTRAARRHVLPTTRSRVRGSALPGAKGHFLFSAWRHWVEACVPDAVVERRVVAGQPLTDR